LVLDDPADSCAGGVSHSGEPVHVDRVRAMLSRGGLTRTTWLSAGPAAQRDGLAAVLRAGGGPASDLQTVPGKHAGMLLTCSIAGWSTAFTRPAHPLQLVCQPPRASPANPWPRWGSTGVPVLAISLTGLARAYRRGGRGVGLPARRVADAMRAYRNWSPVRVAEARCSWGWVGR
jgi:L-asparaginase II